MLPPVGAASRCALSLSLSGLFATCLFGCEKPPAPYKNYSLVLITIETTRSDFLGCYGSDAACTPHLDSLAGRGTRVQECYTVAPWTRPSIGSIWTGLAPARHGATTQDTRSWLPESAWTLAEALSLAGYRTFAYVTNSNLAPELAFDQGFDDYHYRLGARAPLVNEAALDWMAAARRESQSQPLFVALHYDEPHGAFFDATRLEGMDRPEIIAACETLDPIERLWAIEVYRSRIAQVDSAIGTLVEGARRVLGDSCVFVVTADHGEEWFDHGGLFHGFTLHNEILSVPLILYVPGQKPAVVRGPVRTCDLYPTLCEWLGVPVAGDVDGVSLARALRTGKRFPDHVIAETAFREPLASIQEGGYKLIQDVLTGDAALFDLVKDLREEEDIAEERPRVARALRERLERHRSRAARKALRSVAVEASAPDSGGGHDRLEEELRSIGYLVGRKNSPSANTPRARFWWREIRRPYQFITPGDSAIVYESTTRKPASARPRMIVGHRRGDRCWGTFGFQRAYVVLDSHDWSGVAEIQVDHAPWSRIDLFAPQERRGCRVVPIVFDEWGEHRIDIVVTGEKHAASRSTEVLLNGIALERKPGPPVAAATATTPRGADVSASLASAVP